MQLKSSLVNAACELLEAGVPEQKIASTLGVNRSSWSLWLRRGREEKKGKYFNFVKRMEKARTSYLQALVRTAKKLAIDQNIITEEKVIISEDGKKKLIKTITHRPPDARLLMFLLERGFPEEFKEHVASEGLIETQIPTVLDFGLELIDNTERLKQIEQITDGSETDGSGESPADESGAP